MARMSSALQLEVKTALKRIQEKDKSLGEELGKAVGYAVFPSVGRAALLLGGAYGDGLVFEGNQEIGEASVGQLTFGIQLGGQTFSMVVVFRTPEAMERFKHGRIGFTASATAAIAKSGITGTTDYESDVISKSYTLGGMLLEASLGGQGFRFKPKATLEEPARPRRAPGPRRSVSKRRAS